MATRTNSASKQGTQETDDLLGLDVYSADGQPVGRVAGTVPQVPEDAINAELTIVDPIAPGEEGEHPQRVLIDAYGFPAQVLIAMPISLLTIDARARRITLPLTMEQIRDMPHQET